MKKTYIVPALEIENMEIGDLLAFSNPDADTLRGGDMGDAGNMEQLGRDSDFDWDED